MSHLCRFFLPQPEVNPDISKGNIIGFDDVFPSTSTQLLDASHRTYEKMLSSSQVQSETILFRFNFESLQRALYRFLCLASPILCFTRIFFRNTVTMTWSHNQTPRTLRAKDQSTSKRHCSDFRRLFDANIDYTPNNQWLNKPEQRLHSFHDSTRPTHRAFSDSWPHNYTYDPPITARLEPNPQDCFVNNYLTAESTLSISWNIVDIIHFRHCKDNMYHIQPQWFCTPTNFFKLDSPNKKKHGILNQSCFCHLLASTSSRHSSFINVYKSDVFNGHTHTHTHIYIYIYTLLTCIIHSYPNISVVMLAKERHGEHKKVDWKPYIFKYQKQDTSELG